MRVVILTLTMVKLCDRVYIMYFDFYYWWSWNISSVCLGFVVFGLGLFIDDTKNSNIY